MHYCDGAAFAAAALAYPFALALALAFAFAFAFSFAFAFALGTVAGTLANRIGWSYTRRRKIRAVATKRAYQVVA